MSFLSSSQKAIVDRIGNILDDVEARLLLGTVALFAEDRQFGVLEDDRLYLNVDEESRSDFVEAGTEPYSAPNAEQATYLEVPEGVVEDDDALAAWVERSFEAAK